MWDWLSIVVIIAIVLVVLDGLRRKFRERDALKVKLDSSLPGGEDHHNSELPSGGARTIPRGHRSRSASRGRREAEAGERIEPAFGDVLDDTGDDIGDDAGDDRETEDYRADTAVAAERTGPEDGYEDWPGEEAARDTAPGGARQEEAASATEAFRAAPEEDDPLSLDSPEDGLEDEAVTDAAEPAMSRAQEDDALVADREDAPASGRRQKKSSRSLSERFFRHSSVQNELPLDEDEEGAGVDDDEGEEEEDGNAVEEVIIINVMAPRGQEFDGSQLLQILLRQGMRLGHMSIFHRHADNSGSGPVMFSMANMVKPGTFDMASMESFTTPGVSLFTQLPSRLPHMRNFDLMLETAQCLRDELGGELKDENRSDLTRQTIEHYRQRIRDFELHRLARR